MRRATFFQFIRKNKLPFFFTWPFNIGYVLGMAYLLYYAFNAVPGKAVAGPVFLTLGFFGLKLFLYGVAYQSYRAGGKAIQELKGEELKNLSDVGVHIKGYDLSHLEQKFPPITRRTLYNFDYADLVLTSTSMILMGKSKAFGGVSHAYPVEIVKNNPGKTHLPKASIQDWTESGNRVEILVEDPHYKKPISLAFKDKNAEIKKWLDSLQKNQESAIR